MEKLSFIVPIRERNEHAEGLIENIAKYFPENTYEIIFAEQVEKDEPLKHGQLRNLAFQKATGDIIVIMDVDVRLIYPIDIRALYNEHKVPLLLFDQCYDVLEDENEECGYKIAKDMPVWYGKPVRTCHSRLICCSKKEFKQSGGYSNLCYGWGFEDTLFYKRLQPVRLINTIGHMAHGEQSGDVRRTEENRYIYQTDGQRDRHKDGYKQTIATDETDYPTFVNGKVTVKAFPTQQKVKHYKYSNITVPKDFEYMSELNNRKVIGE